MNINLNKVVTTLKDGSDFWYLTDVPLVTTILCFIQTSHNHTKGEKNCHAKWEINCDNKLYEVLS